MSHPSHGKSNEPQPPARGLLAAIYRWVFDLEFKRGFAERVDYTIAVLILVSVGGIVLENVESIFLDYERWFRLFDWLIITIFSVEYLARLLTASHNPQFKGSRTPRLRYMVSFYALVDVIAIIPAYLALLFPLDGGALVALRLFRLLRVFKLGRHLVPAWHEFQALNRHRSFRAKLFALLEPTGHSGRLHAYVDNFVITWVALSIVSVMLQSIHGVQVLFAAEFRVLDTAAFAIFTVEYLARLYTAPEHPSLKGAGWARWRYARSPSAIIDLIAILPTLLEWLVPNALDLRFLRVFRLLQLLKLSRYTAAAVTLYKVINRERQVIVAAGFVMMLLVVLTASMGFVFEHEAQPDKFENIPQSIYWAVITLASVGYGDISPVTPMGRALTVVLALIGIGIFAIPAGLLASAFTDQLRLDREEFKRRLIHAYEGGESASHARALIATEADRLHLSEEDIKRLTAEARDEFEERQKEAGRLAGAIVIDPSRHPEVALAQLQVLAAQVDLLVKAAGAGNLLAKIQVLPAEQALERERLAALIALVESVQPSSNESK